MNLFSQARFLTLSGLTLAALMTFTSCGVEQPPVTSESKYILIGPGYEGLVYRSKNETVNICEKSQNPQDKSAQREFLQIGLKLWWSALDLEDKPVTWDKEGAECDLTVVIRRGVHAHAKPGKRPTIVIDVPSGRMGRQRVVTHELGHAFGLSDTYARFEFEETGRMFYPEQQRCKPGQPEQSIMCNPEKYDTPQEDDIAGVKHAYRNVFGDDGAL